MANAIVPPALIVSSPNSSHFLDAVRTASGSDTPHREPSANRFSYSTRTVCRGSLRVGFHSVNVFATDRAGDARCACLAARLHQVLRSQAFDARKTALLEVPGWQRVQSIEDQQIGGRAQFAVLGRGRSQGPGRQLPGTRDKLLRVCPRAALRAAHEDRFEVLRTQHGSAAAPAGMPAGMGDRGKSNQAFPRRADHRRRKVSAKPRVQFLFGCAARLAPQTAGGFQSHDAVVDDQHRWFGCPPLHHDGITAALLGSDGKTAADQRVIDAVCQRTLGHHREFRRRRQGAADQRAQREDDRRRRRQRVGGRFAVPQQQPSSQAAAAHEAAQDIRGQGEEGSCALGEIHVQVLRVIARHG